MVKSIIIFIALVVVVGVITLIPNVVVILFVIFPIVIPFVLFHVFWVMRLRLAQMKWIEKNGPPCLLEIRLPKEILKSPAGMEIFFSYLSAGGATHYFEALIDGRTRPWFSCEIVSTGGQVKFYIWMSQRTKYKNVVESQLYAQYPGIEIHEVKLEDDYTRKIYFDPEKFFIFGLQFGLKQPDPYPIKTYIDYGLDKEQEEESKIDPLTAVIEHLGSMKAGEHSWIQILVQKHEQEGWLHGSLKRHGKDLKAEVKAEIEKIRKEAIPKSEGDDKTTFKFPNPTQGQNERRAALERVGAKLPFDCLIRSFYITELPTFNVGNISAIVGALRQYNSAALNSFVPTFVTDITDPMKDVPRLFPFMKNFFDREISDYKKELLHAYKLRSFFNWPYKNFHQKPFILTTEELATIFHFPGNLVSQTPTLKRVESKKAEAPVNLPI